MNIESLVPVIDPVTSFVTSWNASVTHDSEGDTFAFINPIAPIGLKTLASYTEQDMQDIRDRALIFPLHTPTYVDASKLPLAFIPQAVGEPVILK